MKTSWIIKGVLGVLAIAALMSGAVMYLWNELMPVIFNLPVISFWQALGLLVLSKLLLKTGGGWSGRGPWKKHWKEKYEKMSPDDKARFRDHWEKRCSQWKGPFPGDDANC
ncbi:hypothetical protein BH11BAC2_BH11BAC2_12960 [soil metagenome]